MCGERKKKRTQRAAISWQEGNPCQLKQIDTIRIKKIWWTCRERPMTSWYIAVLCDLSAMCPHEDAVQITHTMTSEHRQSPTKLKFANQTDSKCISKIICSLHFGATWAQNAIPSCASGQPAKQIQVREVWICVIGQPRRTFLVQKHISRARFLSLRGKHIESCPSSWHQGCKRINLSEL